MGRFCYQGFNVNAREQQYFYGASVHSFAKSESFEKYSLENINHIRDFIDIRDIYSAIKILHAKKSKGIYNLGSGIPIPLIKIIEYLANLFKKKYVINKENKLTMHVADLKKMIRLGWKPKKNILQILNAYHLNFNKK